MSNVFKLAPLPDIYSNNNTHYSPVREHLCTHNARPLQPQAPLDSVSRSRPWSFKAMACLVKKSNFEQNRI